MEDLFFHNIDKYVYDECTDEEMKLFKQHIETCEKCREEYELSCSVKNAMVSMNNITPPADFSKLVNERLDRELAAPAKPRLLKAGYRRYSAVAACLVLAAVLGTQDIEVSEPVIETSTLTGQSLQAVPDKETEAAPTPVPVQAPAEAESTKMPVSPEKATVSTASTKNTPVATPAVTVSTPAAAEPVQTEPVKSEDVYSKIPSHLNPKNQMVLASSVEKTYEISGISPKDIPQRERDLAAEFALLETTSSGAIVANSATIASMEGVQFRISHSSSTPKDYGIGSGSLFISSTDKDIVDELLTKYISVTDKDCYFFTSDNFDLFIKEMNSHGISYQERLVSTNGSNVAVKLIVS
ncbi:MAG: zf-HC2 domain-containing protein [Clostridia bacterium]|nr:zf-HC2 domain-containing protein [Clostridia bacterium]